MPIIRTEIQGGAEWHSLRNKMIGEKRGKLIVIEFSHIGNNYNKFWKAKCECGNTRILCTADFNKNNCPIIS